MDFGLLAEHYSAFSAIAVERASQDHKWGEQNHSDLYWLGILGEEYGEIAKALIEQDTSEEAIESEVVQLAAVCVAYLECRQRERIRAARAAPATVADAPAAPAPLMRRAVADESA